MAEDINDLTPRDVSGRNDLLNLKLDLLIKIFQVGACGGKKDAGFNVSIKKRIRRLSDV